MAQPSGRQPFRFRIPWITTAPPPPTISRPPFRPPGVAPPPSLPRPSPQPRTESRPPSPARTTAQPPSPARRAPSQPPSPIRTAPQSRVISLPSSPQAPSAPRTPPRTDIRPASPSLATPKSQPSPSPAPSKPQQPTPMATVTFPQPGSPLHMASQREATTSEALKQPQSPPRPSPSPGPSTSQESPLATITSPRPPSPPAMALIQAQSPTNTMPSVSPTKTATTHSPESSTDKSYQQDQKTEPREEMKVSSIIPIEEERKRQTRTPELHQEALPSNKQSEEEERQQKKQSHIQEHDVLPKLAAGKETKPAVAIEANSSGSQHSIIHKDIIDDISSITRKLSSNPDENPVSVITLAGENTGATMRLDSESANKERSVRIHRGYKLNQDETSEATTTDGETSSKQTLKSPKTGEDSNNVTYINSNTQTVNNSIMSNSSINVKSPGVHVVFAQYMSEPVKPTGTVDARKAENNLTQPRKLTYEPNVRRRCLRGLMLESSDSDPGNPNKPRRHGCRVDCREKLKGIENENAF